MALDNFIYKFLNKSTARDERVGLIVLKVMLIKVNNMIFTGFSALLLL